MRNTFVAALGITSLGVSACSSTPRNFAPQLSVAPGDPAQYEQVWLECREQVAASAKGAKRAGSAAAGLAAGAGAGAAGAAATSGATYATMGGAAAAGAVIIAAVPVLGLAGAWGYSKIRKMKREKAMKAATADCLDQSGYEVAGWRVLSKREVRELDAARVSPKRSEQFANGTAGSAQ